jgi:23S rRNA pseudouridine2605 synthase
MALLPPDSPRLFPVGRLDRESEGLLLLTDDGDLAERLLHPRYQIEREYAVLVRGSVSQAALAALRAGAEVEGAHVRPLHVEAAPPPPSFGRGSVPGTRWLRMTLAEGRKREVRILCAAAGLDVLRLVRVRLGPLALGDLPAGHTRPLTAAELSALQSPRRA